MKQEFTLTEDQQTAFDNIKEWLDSDKKYYTLAGYSGAGKTTLMDKITDYARSKRISCKLTATTNKAVKVLMNLIDHNDFSTIHSLLNIKPKQSGTQEIFDAVWNGKNDINEYQLVIVDECSMVSQKLLNIIHKKAVSDVKILFVGDPAQLQPINETISPSFEYQGSMLTEVVRHGDGISKTAMKVRSTSDFVPFGELLNPPFIENIEKSELFPYFEGFRDDPDKVRMLCWHNDQVKMWNRILRAYDYQDDNLEPFVKGDIVMANKPCEMHEEVIMMNSEEGIVKRVQEYDDRYALTVNLFSDGEARVNVVKDEYAPNLQKELKKLANTEQWKAYWNLRKYYHDIRHCYALTTHKSQGSSYKYSILDTQDIATNPDLEERNQLIYVAMTRAQEKVLFYNGF